ncbi:hypothetical protein BDN71DRAFT_1453190 [Pleurotus eryngii]|uniref:Uncharacterized protein n=1 Tax=Pleurotus eryngii TaxID=5323 RepID=A0A9P5ZPQ2_PLEER|nr:hypothetical protein BDN71DRAFT_1453190 [Pleurotus eryngii]
MAVWTEGLPAQWVSKHLARLVELFIGCGEQSAVVSGDIKRLASLGRRDLSFDLLPMPFVFPLVVRHPR